MTTRGSVFNRREGVSFQLPLTWSSYFESVPAPGRWACNATVCRHTWHVRPKRQLVRPSAPVAVWAAVVAGLASPATGWSGVPSLAQLLTFALLVIALLIPVLSQKNYPQAYTPLAFCPRNQRNRLKKIAARYRTVSYMVEF
jgi:hypothetical protein